MRLFSVFLARDVLICPWTGILDCFDAVSVGLMNVYIADVL